MNKCLTCGQKLTASPRYRYIEPFVPPNNYCAEHGHTYEQRRENDSDRDTGQPSTEGPASHNKVRDIVHSGENKKWEQIARLIASDQMKGQDPMSGAISFIVSVYFDIPKSWPKWKKEVAEHEWVAHTSKPDADNILKLSLIHISEPTRPY